jgi:hypothetical protein
VRRCLLDTGILYAAADRDDAWNDRDEMAQQFSGNSAARLVNHSRGLLNTYPGADAEIKFMRSLKKRERRSSISAKAISRALKNYRSITS